MYMFCKYVQLGLHAFLFLPVVVCSVDSVLSRLNSPLLCSTLLSFIPLPEVIVKQTVKEVFSGLGTPSGVS